METAPLDQSIVDFHQFGKKLAKQLKRLGIATVRDVLFSFPVRHDDLETITAICDLCAGSTVVIRGKVLSIANRRAFRKRTLVTEALIADASGSVRVVWFQQPYLAHAFVSGTMVILSGMVARDRYGLHLTGSVMERDTDANLHAGRIVPIYALTAGISQKQLRFLIHAALPCATMLADTLPSDLREQEGLLDLQTAIHEIHFPQTHALLARARERFAFEELLTHFRSVRAARSELSTEHAPPIPISADTVACAKGVLPFVLTGAQERALGEILADCSGAPGDAAVRPMARLLNGDVGSGKTAVAFIVAAAVVRAGWQVAYLAPTEVLAAQQAQTLTRWLRALGVSVALWTRTKRSIDGAPVMLRELTAAVRTGAVGVVVGTHALLGDRVAFHRLGLAIVDEQHRFGVEQRAALRRKAHGDATMPHLLSMTATPIPRTLHLTLLGDLRVSVLDERPAARGPVATAVVEASGRMAMTRAVKQELALGHQVFIVCPRIDADGEAIGEIATATEAFARAQQAFPEARVGLLHGRMAAAAQEAVLEAFTARTVDVLVATTVIEVGIDQPNATVMVVEDAERFGLSQLHQLRGRVGRGDAPGTCFLTTRTGAPQVIARLRKVAATTDGFALASLDLAIRGPGAVFGTVQSGWPEFRFATLDPEQIRRAQEACAQWDLSALHTNPTHLE